MLISMNNAVLDHTEVCPGVHDIEAIVTSWPGWVQDLSDPNTPRWFAPDLLREADFFAATWTKLNIRPGASVGVATGNSVSFLSVVISLCRIGAMPVLLSSTASMELLSVMGKTLDIAAIIVPTSRAKRISETMGGKDIVAVTERFSVVDIPSGRRENSDLAQSLALVSSGTTGLPKAVVHDPVKLVQNACLHAKAVGLKGSDTFLLAMPCYFSYGFVAGLLGSIVADCNIVIADFPVLPGAWAKAVREFNVSVFSATPAFFRKLMDEGRFPECLRMITLGGDVTRAEDLERLWTLYDGITHVTYGLSEAGPRVFTHTIPHGQSDCVHVGQPLNGVQVRLKNPNRENNRLIGELLVHTPTAMRGYWKNGALCREDFLDDTWLATGDLFAYDKSNGRLFFVDRLRDVISCGGEKLSAGLIRKVVLDHEDIVAARIDSLADEIYGHVPVATVRLREGVNEVRVLAALPRWCARRIRRVEIPRVFHHDAKLPLSHK